MGPSASLELRAASICRRASAALLAATSAAAACLAGAGSRAAAKGSWLQGGQCPSAAHRNPACTSGSQFRLALAQAPWCQVQEARDPRPCVFGGAAEQGLGAEMGVPWFTLFATPVSQTQPKLAAILWPLFWARWCHNLRKSSMRAQNRGQKMDCLFAGFLNP